VYTIYRCHWIKARLTSPAEDDVNTKNISDALHSILGSLTFMHLGTLAYYKSEIASLKKNRYADMYLT
jgi:hypothetical protein